MRNEISFSDEYKLKQILNQVHLPAGEVTFQCRLKTSNSGPLVQYHQGDKAYLQVTVTPAGKLEFTAVIDGNLHAIQTLRGKINNNQWHIVTAVVNRDALTLFVNGIRVGVKEIDVGSLAMAKRVPLSLGMCADGNRFNVLLTEVGLWEFALSDEQIKQPQSPDKGILLRLDNNDINPSNQTTDLVNQTAIINLFNDSPFDLILSAWEEYHSLVSCNLPPIIKAKSYASLTFSGTATGFKVIAKYRSSRSETSDIVLTTEKSPVAYNSSVEVTIYPELQPVFDRDISVSKSNCSLFEADVRISENLVIVNAKNVDRFVTELSASMDATKIVTSQNYNAQTGLASSSSEQILRYNQASQLFNRRLQEKPLAIIYCTDTEDVQQAYLLATKYNLPISVRSGGHDHEGECSGTNTVLIDLMGLDNTTGITVSNDGIAEIRPGNRFITLTTALAEQGWMLPHGTCATVAIPGFIMGGGWGPWTRKHGMCCEHLIKAEIVLGNGQVEIIDKNNKPDLLWALKGGGGMSYGIVTKLYVQTFELPDEMVKFELEWNLYDDTTQALNEKTETVKILSRWEEIISATDTISLTGTNLKINGKPAEELFCADTVKHNCLMYGYWQGNIPDLKAFIETQFNGLEPDDARIDGIGGLGSDYGKQLMGSWDRESFNNIKLKLAGKAGLPFPPDLDEPAPHKLTSRLVDKQGLGDAGHAGLLQSLTSPLILPGNRALGVFNYVTLGAIDGDFYQNMSIADKAKSAFPYKEKLYTIQYQTWWNNELIEKQKLQNNGVYTRTNRAMDWIEACRDAHIPNTSGAFISFKDSSIPTKTYFAQNYACLVEVKNKYAKDEFNHFRKRKTII